LIAGTEVARNDIAWLAENVEEPTAGALRSALADESAVVTIDIEDRVRLVAALDDPPEALARLRDVLLRDLDHFRRIGLL
jgi:hypothetical protein